MSKFIKVLLVFVAILAVVIYGFWQKNIYSKEGLKLEMFGPGECDLGQEVEYVVKYKNNGDFRLESPTLIFEAPEFAIKDDKIFRKEIIDSEKLGGAIYPGEERSFSFKMRLVGKGGDTKVAKASLSYQPKNLKPRYESSTTSMTIMKEAPMTFEFDLSSKIEADKAFHLRLNYLSNVNWLLTDLRAHIDYPIGFTFSESTPKSIDKNEWDIPVLNKDQVGTIDVTGRLSGDLGDAKVFRANIGMWKEGEFVLLKQIEKGVQIIKPTVAVHQDINGDSRYVAKPGDWLHYEIYYKNISEQELSNQFIVNKLEGDLFDFSTLKSETGSFQSGDNSIIFDWKQNDALAYLAPMEEGKVEFWIKLKDDSSQLKQPELRNRVMIGPAREDFTTKISSRLEMVQKGFYNDEIFGNTGPLPPRVGQATTYTVTWQVKNYYSNVKNAKVTAILPANVTLVGGQVFPETQAGKLAFDAGTRTLIWDIGAIRPGQGALSDPLNVSFQVTLMPTVDQAQSKAPIVGEATLAGDDEWTNLQLKATGAALDTQSISDQDMTEGKGKVQS